MKGMKDMEKRVPMAAKIMFTASGRPKNASSERRSPSRDE